MLAQISFAVELIAFSFGFSLIIWSMRTQGAGTMLAKIVGIIVVVLAVLDMVCTSYTSARYSTMMHKMHQEMMMRDQGMPGMRPGNNRMPADTRMQRPGSMPASQQDETR